MSYCRWENTLHDLQDCFNSIVESDGEKLSESEANAKRQIYELMKEMLEYTEEKVCPVCAEYAMEFDEEAKMWSCRCGHEEDGE
jgi:hypothetical protein